MLTPNNSFRSTKRLGYALPSLILLLITFLQSSPASPRLLLCIPAGQGGPTKHWTVNNSSGSVTGKVLSAGAYDGIAESNGIPVTIPTAGPYSIWVRYFKQDTNCSAFFILFRDEEGDDVAFHICDFVPVLPTSKPYSPASSPAGTRTGFIWERFEAVIEHPLTAKISFGGVIHRGGYSARSVDCVLITDDQHFDPSKLELDVLKKLSLTSTQPLSMRQHNGKRQGDVSLHHRVQVSAFTKPSRSPFLLSKGYLPTPERFAGVKDPDSQFHLGIIHNASTFVNHAQALQLGFNRDHALIPNRYGIKTLYPTESYTDATADFTKRHPSPEGRFVNADGQVGTLWSLSYPPFQEELAKVLEERVKPNADRAEVEFWRISGEAGGWMDYSPSAQTAFRAWLTDKHKNIDALNARWGTKYGNFDQILPPKKFEENRPCWFEFRDFCGTVFAEAVARQMPIIRQLDPKKRSCIGQNSNLDLFAPYFTSMRPMDWEQYINVALAGERYVGWDTYCADDYIGCEVDLMRSISGGRDLLNMEWNPHAVDPRIAARSYWTQIGKGIRGIYCFQFHEGTYHDSYPKWSLVRGDLTPKDKLGAIADAAHEVHRLEPLLAKARVTYAVKPLALYYSRLDLSLAQAHLSLWADGMDSPFHVYEILRGLGYAVRWITPRQIIAGELEKVGAVVMVDCQYVPAEAATKLEEWVKAGGVLVGDRWPGAWNEYAQPQDALSQVFGIKAALKKTESGKLAMQQSSQGYGEVTMSALDQKSLAESVGEMWHQWDSKHPVARAVGDFMLSGYGFQQVQCVSGEVIGMGFDAWPGVVLNEYGRGKSLYFAMMLGSIYESAAAKYEWDTTHSGRSLARILDAFLKYSGIQPASVAHVSTPRLASKLRVEAPLMTPEGNVLVCVTSMNDAPVGPFFLEIELPKQAPPVRKVLVSTGGSRRLQTVDFKITGSRLQLTMPAFDTHATVIALQQSEPLIGLEVTGAPRGTAGLLVTKPGVELTVKATVYNPQPMALSLRALELWLPRGWSQNAYSLSVPAIPAWGSKMVSFRVRPPAVSSALRLKPLLVRYQGSAAPATELVWWGK